MPSMDRQQEHAFTAHVTDMLKAAQKGNPARFTGFLDLYQASEARTLIAAHPQAGAMFYGGFPEAERVMLGVFPEWEEPQTEHFPIVPVTIRFRKEDAVGPRDLLGSILGLGLSREAVGDILVEDGRAICFLTQTAGRLVLEELQKAGRVGLQTEKGYLEPLPEKRFTELQVNVSSLRVDCVVSALTGLSREKAQQLIKSRLVCVDGGVCSDVSGKVAPGNILSLRGYGKFIFFQILRTTKKDRLVLLCRKYE